MIRISDIVKKEFTRSFMGYDMREVDLFLDEIIEQMETYERERQEMLTAMEYLLRELEQFDDIADDAEKQLKDLADMEQAAGAGARGRNRTVRVHPVVPPADPAREVAPEEAPEENIVLEEIEIRSAAPIESGEAEDIPQEESVDEISAGEAADAVSDDPSAAESAVVTEVELKPSFEDDLHAAASDAEPPAAESLRVPMDTPEEEDILETQTN